MVDRWGEDEAVRDERLPLEYAVLPAQRRLCRWEEIRAVTTVRTGSGPSARTFIQLVRQDSRAVTLQAPVDLAEDPDHRFRRAHAIVRDTWEERRGGGAV
ncbi:hypothetical protein [Streptomyces sp. st115]|uniref:hypothetical protein n=1 Tax=Streptomyces sp. st115 TaxID=1828047 RepID=UPI000BF1A77E|nr:hypothetical protein [Streptomyces sp. st115]